MDAAIDQRGRRRSLEVKCVGDELPVEDLLEDGVSLAGLGVAWRRARGGKVGVTVLPTLPGNIAPFSSLTLPESRILFFPVSEPFPESLSLSLCSLAPVLAAFRA